MYIFVSENQVFFEGMF